MLQVGADDRVVLDQIIDSLNSLANRSENDGNLEKDEGLTVGKVEPNEVNEKIRTQVLILGAGRVCRPAVQLLVSKSHQWCKEDTEEETGIQVIVGSLYLKEAEEVYNTVEPNAQLNHLYIY